MFNHFLNKFEPFFEPFFEPLRLGTTSAEGLPRWKSLPGTKAARAGSPARRSGAQFDPVS